MQPLGTYYTNKEAKRCLCFLPQGLNEQFVFSAVITENFRGLQMQF